MKTQMAALMTVVCFGLSAHAYDGEKLKQEFVGITHLKEGDVHVDSSPRDCLTGEIELLPIEDGSLSVLLGAQAIIGALGIPPVHEPDPRCPRDEAATFGDHFVKSTIVDNCRGAKIVRENRIEVTPAGDGFRWETTVTRNGVVKLHSVCKYSY